MAENDGTGLPLERQRHYHADLLLVRVEQYAILMGGMASSAFQFLASVYLQLFPLRTIVERLSCNHPPLALTAKLPLPLLEKIPIIPKPT